MTKRVVLFQNGGQPLLLDRLVYGDDGVVKAHVVNGDWTLRITCDELLSTSGKVIVHRWTKVNLTFVPVPDEILGDYNEIIEWAEGKL